MHYVTIEKFATEHGYTPEAVRQKIKSGVWPQGWIWKKAPDGRILICVEGFSIWVESGNPGGSVSAAAEESR